MIMSIETGMYLYPWEIDDLESFKTDYAATGCTGMTPALSYHHGNILIARTGRFKTVSEAALSFVPRDELYGLIRGEVHPKTARTGIVKALRQWCADTGRVFSGWVVLLHNSTQGERRPELCLENLFGDTYTHALCPSHPEVRLYAQALLTDICGQFAPDSLTMESLTVQPVQHGVHHEIAAIAMTPALRWIFSLCFCPRCMIRAAQLMPDLDPEALRERVKKLVLALANSEAVIAGNGDAQAMMLMLEIPELFAYQQARQLMISEFIREISAQLRKAHVEFRLIPSALPFDINRAYLEGMSFASTAGLADRLMPLVYGPGETYGLVRNNIRLLDSETPVGMASTLSPGRFPDKGGFLGAMTAARSEGCETFCIYNYSMVSLERLAWISKMNEVLL
jgi:hypothetical protein